MLLGVSLPQRERDKTGLKYGNTLIIRTSPALGSTRSYRARRPSRSTVQVEKGLAGLESSLDPYSGPFDATTPLRTRSDSSFVHFKPPSS